MKRRPLPLSGAVLPLLLSACVVVVGRHDLRGSGILVDEDRSVAEFTAVELELGADATVRVGEATSVVVSADDNVLPYIVTRVHDGVLEITLEDAWSVDADVRVAITTPRLERFSIDGAGDVRISGLSGERFRADIDGAGTIRASGSARLVEADIDGAGTIDLEEVEAERAEVDIDGAGTIRVHATRSLSYDIDGSGDVTYRGDPEVDGEVDGSGSVTRRR